MEELDGLITYLENDLIPEHENKKYVTDLVKMYAEVYSNKQNEELTKELEELREYKKRRQEKDREDASYHWRTPN